MSQPQASKAAGMGFKRESCSDERRRGAGLPDVRRGKVRKRVPVFGESEGEGFDEGRGSDIDGERRRRRIELPTEGR